MKSSTIQPVAWHDGKLRLLDQRQLPLKEIYLTLDSAAATAEAIRDMVVRGAPAIGCAAAYGLAAEAHRLAGTESSSMDYSSKRDFHGKAIASAARTLIESRPTAVNLTWAVNRLQRALRSSTSTDPVPQTLLAEADAILEEDLAACRAMGQHGAALLPDTGDRTITLLTHCNAGALATAGYGTALGVMRAVHESGRPMRVIATETRPLLQGARLTAWELAREKIDTLLITESMVGSLMARGEIDAVVVGADRVAANGDVANKIGTYTIAVLARWHHIPFFVICPHSTIDLKTPNGATIPIEERLSEEITHWHGHRIAANVTAFNPAFDITPTDLIQAVITETGPFIRSDE